MKTMKYLKLALLALVAVFATASCMDDDWKEPNSETSPYGNNSIQETNVVSIAELKETYGKKQKDKINDMVRIADGTQIKGIVTGNDIEGNIYSQIAIQDESDKPNKPGEKVPSGIIISVAQGGLSGQLQIGQEVLINVGGLYYGTYRSQPQLGVAYHDSSKDQNYPSRISRADWQNRFKIIGKPDASKIKVQVFSTNPDASGRGVCKWRRNHNSCSRVRRQGSWLWRDTLLQGLRQDQQADRYTYQLLCRLCCRACSTGQTRCNGRPLLLQVKR